MTDQLRPPARPLSLPRLPLIGREDDLQQLLALARRPTTRLITVIGLGGIGKTRLAFELAERLADERRAVVVELASVSDADDVVPAVAEALEIPGSGDDALHDVAAALDGQHTVLVLDNLEQIPDAGRLVAQLSAAAPDTLVVATSRVPLGITGEHLWRTRPLDLPADDGADVDSAAMQLFRSVAEAMDGRFVLDDRTRADAAVICRRLGGHPLAIELAAARLPHLGPGGLRRELERRTSTMFAATRADAPDRHRDLVSTIGWSYEQLDESARRLFRRLGVWESWTTLELIEPFAEPPRPDGSPDTLHSSGAHTSGAHTSGGDTSDVLDALAMLVDHHLVEVAHDRDQSRYRLLPPVRDVAVSMLRTDPTEHAAASAAHESCLHAVARASVATDDEPGGHEWVPLLDSLRPDLVAALDRAIAGGRATTAADLASALAWVWSNRRVFDVHLTRIDHAADLQDEDGDPTALDPTAQASRAYLHGWRLVIHASAGASGSRLRELDRHRPSLEAASASSCAPVQEAVSWMLLQTLRAFVIAHAADDAARVGDELLAFTAGRDDRWEARAEALVGMVANLRGQHDRALELGLSALDRARRVGDDKTVVRAALLLGPLEGHRHAPVIDLAEASAVARRLGDPEVLDWVLPSLAIDAYLRGDVAVGARYCAESFSAPPWGGADQGTVSAAVLAVLAAEVSPVDSARVHGMLRDRWRIVESHLLPAQRAAYHGTIEHVRGRLGGTAFDVAVGDGSQLDWRTAVQEMHRIALRLAGSADDSGSLAREHVDALTAREVEVLRLLATGATNKEISRTLSLSAKTVMHHTTAIYRKLGVRGRTEAAAVAHRSGLVPD